MSSVDTSNPDAQVILNTIPHPVLVLSRDLRLVFSNDAAEQFFAVSSSVLKRNPLSDILSVNSPLVTLIEQVFNSHASVNEYDVELASPRFGERSVDVQVTLIDDDQQHALVLLQERTMAQKMDRQLSSRGAARSVVGMAAVLAHEIKNPLSGIRGAAQLLELGASAEDKSLTKLIVDEVDRIRNLVNRMEVFSDERPIPRKPVNIHSVLGHVKKLAESGFARQIAILEEYDPSLPAVLGDRDQLIQVFLNLIKNAAEAIGDREGEIVLTTAYRPGVRLSVPGSRDRVGLPLEICVIDNGPGVPTDLLPYLFDPFVTTKASGSGLGLALVAKVVRDHGGIIECESQPRRTIFRVLMPMQAGSKQAHESATSPETN
ncbi:MAG: PAS domain-containing protein [Parvibaculaceae bacterium]|nr:PAS domain-containing protein [Parvibaculaceae bacterium]